VFVLSLNKGVWFPYGSAKIQEKSSLFTLVFQAYSNHWRSVNVEDVKPDTTDKIYAQHLVLCNKQTFYHHHHLPPWIRSLDLFRHRRVAIVSWGVHGLFFL
jgi:hypothetical protein